MNASAAQLAALAKLLGLDARELRRKLAEDDRRFAYLKRQVDTEVAERVAALQLAGIHQQREYKRHYPEGGRSRTWSASPTSRIAARKASNSRGTRSWPGARAAGG